VEIVSNPTQNPINHLIKNQPTITEKVFIPKLSSTIKRPIKTHKTFSVKTQTQI
jgi:hypothetical protein